MKKIKIIIQLLLNIKLFSFSVSIQISIYWPGIMKINTNKKNNILKVSCELIFFVEILFIV